MMKKDKNQHFIQISIIETWNFDLMNNFNIKQFQNRILAKLSDLVVFFN